jgi:hypothetical protein
MSVAGRRIAADNPSEKTGAEVTEQITLEAAVVAICVCGVCFVLLVPAVAVAAVLGNMAGAVRLLGFGLVLAAAASVLSAALGATPTAYSILT